MVCMLAMGSSVRAVFSALALAVLAGAAKINTPRVLLPWLDANTRVNFTFEITEGGCYTWSLSRDDLVSLEPVYSDSWGHCSRAALVTPVPTCASVIPGSVIILAEDIITGEIIRGDLNVDKISSLKIVSTTWKLYLEEAPEAFELELFDDQGNKFSSMEGVEFNWKVENMDDKKSEEPVVKLVWWRDTDYEAPPGISELESQGRRSHSVLLYGQTMGEARVTACLNKTCSDVAINVVASVVLNPAAAVVAPGDEIRFKVVRARAGKLTVEDVGDTLYRLYIPDDGIATLEDAVSLVRARTIGSTSVALLSGSTEVASSTLTVANPHSIRVVLRPSNLLVRGEPFVVRAIVMDKHGRALTAGEKTLVRLSVEGDADISLIKSTENGTVTDALADSSGSATIRALLHSVAGKTLTKRVEGSTEATVVEPLEIIPPELFIAWTDTRIEVQLQHRGGGDGPVTWSSELASGELAVDSKGLVRVDSVGHTTVWAHLTEHPHVQAQSQVWVTEAQSVQVASSGYARVARPHELHVALTGTHPQTGRLFNFHKCDCSSFAVTLLEGPEPQNLTAAQWIEPLEGACCVFVATWQERGACVLRVSRGSIGDTARVLVRAEPKLIWPPAAAMLPGASLPVLAAGEELAARILDPAIAEVRLRAPPTPHAHPDLQLFTITCLKKGDTSLELQFRSNDDEELGGEAALACSAKVARVKLETPGCNCSGSARLWLRAGGEAAVTVTLLDAAARELLDEQGHRVTWETSPSNSALEYASPSRLLLHTDPEYDPVPVPLRYYQEVRAGEGAVGWSGTIRATAGDASATIQARVVAPLVATPHYVSVAWEESTPSNVAKVTGGSGRYTVDTRKGASATLDTGLLTATWPGPGRYQLLVTDTCLVNEVVTVEVRVEEVMSVEVSGPRAICVDTCVAFAAVAHGASGRALSTSSNAVWRVGGAAVYKDGLLCGVKEGTVAVRAAIAGVWSPEVEVVVFPVLGIRPERVRVPPGARMQLTHVGGPPLHLATLVYAAAQSDEALAVTHSGLLSGLRVGTGRVRLVAKDRDGTEIAHAEAEVEVVGVTGIRGVAATHTLLVGAEAPLWLEASPALGAEALAALFPVPRVTWSLRDPTAATLAVPLHTIQSSDKSTAEGLSVRLTPLRDGLVIVDVRVRDFVQSGETRSWDTVVEVLALSDLTTSVEGLSVEAVDPQRVSIAIGGTINLRSSMRAVWSAVATSDEATFEITSSGQVKGLRSGFGVVIARERDEKNSYDRETVVHIEVAAPHYITTQVVPDDDETILRVEARSALGRRLLAHNLTLHRDRRLAFHIRPTSRVTGTEVIVTGLDNTETFTVIEAATSSSTLRDYIYLEAPDKTSQRITAGAGHAVCLAGVGWKAAGSEVWLGERGGVTLAVLRSQGAGRVQLKAERPMRSVTIVQMPATKMEFLHGEWSAALVPLILETGVSSPMVQCSEEQRSVVADVLPPLPFLCSAPEPYIAKPVLDTFLGQMGCSVTSDNLIMEAREIEVCASWSSLRACTHVLLLPPVRLTTDRLTLTDKAESFTVTGHASALKSVTISSSPGIGTRAESTLDGLVVSVWSEERECGAGWVWVRAHRTAQALRVHVARECETTCGSLLALAFALLRPYLTFLVVAAAAAAAAIYVYTQHWLTFNNRGRSSKPVSSESVVPPSPSSSHPRTWPRSPYATPKLSPTVDQRPSPVYGDASLLPDSSFSPNSRGHSRFL